MSKMIVTASQGKTVNVRISPSRTASIITTIPLKKEVTLVEKTSDEWYKIEYQGVTGYMMSKFLISNNNSPISKDDLRKVYDSLSDTLKLIEKILK